MQDHQPKKPLSPLIRVLALILALIVIGGSIFAIVSPRQKAPASLLSSVSHAYADSTEKPWKDLKRGSSGAEVRRAQQALQALEYYDGKIDGNFSKAFEAAVLAFQKDFGLEENGVLDEETYLLLIAELPEETPSPAPTARPPSPAPTARPTAAPRPSASPAPREDARDAEEVVYGESYSDKEHVAAYLRLFRELPPNYITKQEAQALGWVSSWGNLWKVAPGKSIGGDRFGNYERQLPVRQGRTYYECDIDYDLDRNRYNGGRNDKRIIYSNDGLIFYTGDHYKTFEEITEP